MKSKSQSWVKVYSPIKIKRITEAFRFVLTLLHSVSIITQLVSHLVLPSITPIQNYTYFVFYHLRITLIVSVVKIPPTPSYYYNYSQFLCSMFCPSQDQQSIRSADLAGGIFYVKYLPKHSNILGERSPGKNGPVLKL